MSLRKIELRDAGQTADIGKIIAVETSGTEGQYVLLDNKGKTWWWREAEALTRTRIEARAVAIGKGTRSMVALDTEGTVRFANKSVQYLAIQNTSTPHVSMAIGGDICATVTNTGEVGFTKQTDPKKTTW